LVYITKRPAL